MTSPKQQFWGGLFLALVSVLGLFAAIAINRRDVERGYILTRSGSRMERGSADFDRMLSMRYVLEGLCVVAAVVGVGKAATATRPTCETEH